MRQLLGGSEEDACFALPSPFPPENLRVYVRNLSTRYRERADTAQAVAALISETVASRRGNYIAYFPSYAYLHLVQTQLEESLLPTLWVQTPQMDEKDRDAFFKAFADNGTPRLGLCVLGGLFSEGIDLPGDKLIGVMVIGVGLPTPSQKQTAIQQRYDELFGDGFHFACRIPGIQKVLQAGGRVIRSEADRGVLVLVDDRYRQPVYRSLLPAHWQLCKEAAITHPQETSAKER
jgi:Rad3-related DNA helicase